LQRMMLVFMDLASG
jgi:hypothetical protein